jgi:hypothetical protein
VEPFGLMFSHFEGSKEEVVAKYPAIQSFLDGIRARDRIKRRGQLER